MYYQTDSIFSSLARTAFVFRNNSVKDAHLAHNEFKFLTKVIHRFCCDGGAHGDMDVLGLGLVSEGFPSYS